MFRQLQYLNCRSKTAEQWHSSLKTSSTSNKSEIISHRVSFVTFRKFYRLADGPMLLCSAERTIQFTYLNWQLWELQIRKSRVFLLPWMLSRKHFHWLVFTSDGRQSRSRNQNARPLKVGTWDVARTINFWKKLNDAQVKRRPTFFKRHGWHALACLYSPTTNNRSCLRTP